MRGWAAKFIYATASRTFNNGVSPNGVEPSCSLTIYALCQPTHTFSGFCHEGPLPESEPRVRRQSLYGVTFPVSLNFHLTQNKKWFLPVNVSPFLGAETRNDRNVVYATQPTTNPDVFNIVRQDGTVFAYGATADAGVRYLFDNGIGLYGGSASSSTRGTTNSWPGAPLSTCPSASASRWEAPDARGRQGGFRARNSRRVREGREMRLTPAGLKAYVPRPGGVLMVRRVPLLVLLILLVQALPTAAGQLNVNGQYLACSEIEAVPGRLLPQYFDATVVQDVVVMGGQIRDAIYISFQQLSNDAPGFLAVGVIAQRPADVAMPNIIGLEGGGPVISFPSGLPIEGSTLDAGEFVILRTDIVDENCLTSALFPDTLAIPARSLILGFNVTIQGRSLNFLGLYLRLIFQ